MLSKLRPRSVYDVAAALSLFIALGGTAYAVAANSVGTAQLKSGAVTNPKLAQDAVGGGKVIDHSLSGADINAATLPGSEAWHDVGIHEGDTDCSQQPQMFCLQSDPGGSGGYSAWTLADDSGPGQTYNRPGFYRDREGIVHLQGLARCIDSFSTAYCGNSHFTIFYLPPGYRPGARLFFPTRAGGETANHYVLVDSPGWVRADGSPQVKTSVSLEGISFRCAPVGQNGCK